MKKHENRFCVYLHTRPDNNTIFYIGIGLPHRPLELHGRNKHWRNIVAKNNGNFIVDILIENLSWDTCSQMEIRLIKQYGRKDKGEGLLCNLTDGGEGAVGRIMPQDHKDKIAKANTGKRYAYKARPSTQGRKQPEWFAAHIAKANFGRKNSEEVIKNMRAVKTPKNCIIEQVCIETGEVLNRFVSMASAFRSTGISAPNICGYIKGKKGKAGGFHWRRSYDLSDFDELLAIAV